MPDVNPMEELAQDAMVKAATSMAAEAFLVREATRASTEEDASVLMRAAIILTGYRLRREARDA